MSINQDVHITDTRYKKEVWIEKTKNQLMLSRG